MNDKMFTENFGRSFNILERRRGEPTYALHFEWLYIKLKKKHPSWESPDQTV